MAKERKPRNRPGSARRKRVKFGVSVKWHHAPNGKIIRLPDEGGVMRLGGDVAAIPQNLLDGTQPPAVGLPRGAD